MIQIVNYGVGNINSIANMLKKVGAEVRLVDSPQALSPENKLILPGVGAFDHGMENLDRLGWRAALTDLVLKHNTPILGICLGMQLLCRRSEEGKLQGLGWLDADVKHFGFPANSPLKIPHMGWNVVDIQKPNPLLAADRDEHRFYFVHSYHVVCDQQEDVLATTQYGGAVAAAVQRGNIFGVQFHPEKSHRFGMALMKRFLEH